MCAPLAPYPHPAKMRSAMSVQLLFLPSAAPATPKPLRRPKISPICRGAISLSPSSSSSSFSRTSPQIRTVRCEAAREGSQPQKFGEDQTIYKGIYGPWTVDSADVREVLLYRAGLVTVASSFVIGAASAFLPEDSFLMSIVKQNIDVLYAIGAGGLGLSLFLIHIYVTPIKRTLQSLWSIGAVGSLATYLNLAKPSSESLVQYVVHNPVAVWFIGPLFASLTGLVFKEGLCYGKLEAGILTFIIPTVLLGHLSGLMDDNAKLSLLGAWMVLFIIFAARKFTQPIKDDIGDKSVFMFNALPEEEKQALIEQLERQFGQDLN